MISNLLIGAAFRVIPYRQYVIQSKKTDSPYRPIILMFVVFVLASGVTHLIEVWAKWRGEYGVLGFSKGVTAFLSASVAIKLLLSLRRLPALENHEELETLNSELQSEIDSQKTAALKLERTEKELRMVLQQAPDGMLVVDALGKINYSNEMMNAMFGHPAGGLDGKFVREILPERSQHKISEKHNDLYETDGSLWGSGGAEFTGRRKDGSEFPVETRVNAIYSEENGDVTLSTFRDISERKLHEEGTRKELLELAHLSRLSTACRSNY